MAGDAATGTAAGNSDQDRHQERTRRAVAVGASVLPTLAQKPAFVQGMFDAIAPRYDFLNSLLSLRLHHRWRRIAGGLTRLAPGGCALDVCCGTGDLALELARLVGTRGQVIASDFSLPMLRLGAMKARRRAPQTVQLALADTQNLPFPDASFDAVTVAFGIRNVADLDGALDEMTRVTRPGGRVVLLEFNRPQSPLFGALYQLYSYTLMPLLGGLISGRRNAYAYLPASIGAFHSRNALAQKMRDAGLVDILVRDLTFGVAVVHVGTRPAVDTETVDTETAQSRTAETRTVEREA